jgi:hypothetical protein
MTREDITRMAREAGFVGFDGDNGGLRRFAALVAAAKRQWVGLTDEEIIQIALETPIGGTNFARVIEAKLREKNGGQA